MKLKHYILQTTTRALRSAGSCKELAKQTGIRAQTISSWLKGASPSLGLFSKIEKYYSNNELESDDSDHPTIERENAP
jgi:transcriptional regulator with XRE-family HTH domain